MYMSFQYSLPEHVHCVDVRRLLGKCTETFDIYAASASSSDNSCFVRFRYTFSKRRRSCNSIAYILNIHYTYMTMVVWVYELFIRPWIWIWLYVYCILYNVHVCNAGHNEQISIQGGHPIHNPGPAGILT